MTKQNFFLFLLNPSQLNHNISGIVSNFYISPCKNQTKLKKNNKKSMRIIEENGISLLFQSNEKEINSTLNSKSITINTTKLWLLIYLKKIYCTARYTYVCV